MPPRQIKKHNAVPCLYPDCKYLSFARSLCSNHYNGAQRRVRAGKITWAELEVLKLATAPEKNQKGFDDVIEERRNEALKHG